MTNVVNPAEPVDYSTAITPSSYTCCGCGRSGVKLWRDYQTFLEHQSLKCADCSAQEQNKDISGMKDNGMYDGQLGPSDQIGWRIPAVPTETNDSFWGYTSIPQDGVEWWERLPLR